MSHGLLPLLFLSLKRLLHQLINCAQKFKSRPDSPLSLHPHVNPLFSSVDSPLKFLLSLFTSLNSCYPVTIRSRPRGPTPSYLVLRLSLFPLLLLLSHFSRVQLCATPSLGFSRREYWSGVPLPSPTFPLSNPLFTWKSHCYLRCEHSYLLFPLKMLCSLVIYFMHSIDSVYHNIVIIFCQCHNIDSVKY